MTQSQSTFSRFLGGTIATGFGKLSIVLVGFINLIITARMLSVEELGAFALLQVIANFLVELSSFGLHLAVPKFISGVEDEDEQIRFASTIFYFRVVTLIVTALIALLAHQAFANLFGGSLMLNLVLYIPVLLILDGMWLLLATYLQGLLKFKVIGLVNFITSMLNFLGVILFVVVLDMGVLGLIYARITSHILGYSYAFISTRIVPKLEFDMGILRKLLVFGFPLQVNYILTFIFLRIDTFIIGILLGPLQVGYYEIARKIPDSLEMIYDSFRQVYYPFVSKFHEQGEKKKFSEMLNTSTRLITFIVILGALIIFAFGDEIVTLLFSYQYLASVPAFFFLMIALALTLLDYTLGYSLVAIDQADKPPIINVVRTAVSFIGYLLLVPRLDITGAALATALGSLFAVPLNVFFLRRKKVDVNVLDFVKSFLVFLALVGLHFLLNLPGILEGVLIILAYLLGGFVLSIYKTSDVSILFNEIKNMWDRYLGRLQSRRTQA